MKHKKILFFLGHPAHYHLFKNVIKRLREKNHKCIVVVKKKDVLEELLQNDDIEYINILPGGRGDSIFGIFWGLLKKELKIFSICRREQPDLMLGYSAEIAHIGKLLNIPAINVNEDDAKAIDTFSKVTYPFTTYILSPSSCDNGRWNKKTINYNSYHELAYLHPKHFKPDKSKTPLKHNEEKYFLLRFAKLSAHHDFGKKGLSLDVAKKVVAALSNHGNIYITSEREIEPELEKYRLSVSPSDIHHVLAYAQMVVADSQTMIAEAAVLGTPSLRFNDFVGKLGYLEELEHKYQLTYGIKTSDPETLISKIKELVVQQNIESEWANRRSVMLKSTIDTTALMVWFIENYPESAEIMKNNPDYQYRFA